MKTATKQTYIIMYGSAEKPKAEMILTASLESIWRMLWNNPVLLEMDPQYIVLPDARRIELNYSLFHHCYDNGRISEDELINLCIPEKQKQLQEVKSKISSAFNTMWC